MAYYDLISEREMNLYNALYRIVSSISFIPYIFVIVLFFCTKSKIKYCLYLKINLLVACIMHNLSYMFPSMSETATASNSLLCLFQGLFNSLSDLASISIALSMVIFTYLAFMKPEFLEEYGILFIIVTFIYCWIIPLIICIIIFYFGEVKSGGDVFCWVSNTIVSFCYYGIIIVYYIIFYSCLYVILKKSSQESLNVTRHLISLYSIVPSLTFIIMSTNFSLTVIYQFAVIPGQLEFCLLLIAQIGEMISCPLYVLVYSLEKELLIDFYKKICKKGGQKRTNSEFIDLLDERDAITE